MAYHETLPERQQHLTHRLESFGDVVFGFAISQLGLQLVLPNSPADMAHPVRFLIYFGTFAALAGLWFNYHRILSGAYAPTKTDVLLTFVFLAFVTLVPYAMYAYAHFAAHIDWIRAGLGAYLVCFAGTMAPSVAITWRNFRRGWYHFDDAERLALWRRLAVVSVVALMLIVALAVDLAVPVDLAWNIVPPAGAVLMLIPVVIRVVRRTVARAVPTADRLRIPPDTQAPSATAVPGP